MNNSEETFFSLEVTKADGSSMTYRFAQTATVGTDPRNDIILIGSNMGPKYLDFKNNGECLTLKFLGTDATATLNNSPLLKNRMYIVEKKDSIQIGLIKIIIL
jgi:hypothetical protein